MTSHGAIRLIDDNCTSCMICVRECPTWCISLSAHQEPDPASPPGRHQRMVHVLDEFSIDWGLCMYCGICVEECPFDALEWIDGHPRAADSLSGLIHGRERLVEERC